MVVGLREVSLQHPEALHVHHASKGANGRAWLKVGLRH